MAKSNGDELTRPVRVYADIPQSLDIAMKIHCAKIGRTRKELLAHLIAQYFNAPGARAFESLSQRQLKKG